MAVLRQAAVYLFQKKLYKNIRAEIIPARKQSKRTEISLIVHSCLFIKGSRSSETFLIKEKNRVIFIKGVMGYRVEKI